MYLSICFNTFEALTINFFQKFKLTNLSSVAEGDLNNRVRKRKEAALFFFLKMYRFLEIEIEYTEHIGQRPGNVWFFIV